jgi:hypothetical protein
MKTPRELSEELLELSGEYSNKTDELNQLLDLKAVNWIKIREMTKSDASADRKWESLPEGMRERSLRLLLKSYEKRMSAIKTAISVMEGEARNMW